MHIFLSHLPNDPLGDFWKQAFSQCGDVEIVSGNILDITASAYISPANSFGFMNGGIDQVYTDHFGADLEKRVRAEIASRPMQELLVGEAIVVPTENVDVPWMIVAPTMRVPHRIDNTINTYLCMKAILLAAKAHPAIESIAVPGLGTGTGFMPPLHAAAQMRMAYDEIILGFQKPVESLSREMARQHMMNPDSIKSQFSGVSHE